MHDSQFLQAKLGVIEQGSRWFEVIGVVLLVVGFLVLGAGGLKLLRLLGDFNWSYLASDLFAAIVGSVNFFALAWVARRAADAFAAIAALIRELGEIV